MNHHQKLRPNCLECLCGHLDQLGRLTQVDPLGDDNLDALQYQYQMHWLLHQLTSGLLHYPKQHQVY